MRDAYSWTEDEFEEQFKTPPVNDDMERINCRKVGEPGHRYCGFCIIHNERRTICGCGVFQREKTH